MADAERDARTRAEIAGTAAAHRQLLDDLAPLTDGAARGPSLLPGWTVGHVVTHLARNADAFTAVTEAALRGEVGDVYPGGPEGRNADIEAGAGRPAAALVEDVTRACGALEAVWARTDGATWRNGQAGMFGRGDDRFPLSWLPYRRWREAAVHRTDLGLSPEPFWSTWPADFVTCELAASLPALAGRLPEDVGIRLTITDAVADDGEVVDVVRGDAAPVTGRIARAELVAWLMGRAARADLPPLGPWIPRQPHP
jgi:maleylpyruvate isomerase